VAAHYCTVVKPQRFRLYPLLGLAAPAGAAAPARSAAAHLKVVDENESYAALVSSAGR
jgi:hypothetical protein